MLDKLSNIAGRAIDILGVVGDVLDIVVELGAKLVKLFNFEKGEAILDFIKKYSIADKIDKVVDILKKFAK